MSALPDNIVPFAIPKRPRIKPKDAPPDQRRLAVLPIRAGKDQRLHGSTLRTLIVLCSYVNRAGLTWVSQAKLAEDLGVSRQAVQKQLALLQTTGYVQVVKKGFRGEYSNTLRVVFDEGVDAETAIAITSAQENTRPPTMQDDTPDPAGQARIASLIKQALKNPNPKKEYTMPKSGETRTVQAIKEANAKATRRRTASSHTQPPEVANEQASQVANEAVDNSGSEASIGNLQRLRHVQPPEVAPTREERIGDSSKDKVYLKTIGVLCNLSEVQRAEIASAGVTDAEASQALELLLDTYRSEGLTPNQATLAAEVISLADAGRIQ